MALALRSMRAIIRTYRRNIESISNNYDAYTHDWLARGYRHYMDQNFWNRRNPIPFQVSHMQEEEAHRILLENKFIRFVERQLKTPVVKVTNPRTGKEMFLPRKCCRSYYKYDTFEDRFWQEWYPVKTWEARRANGMIKWCPEAKNWFMSSAIAPVLYFKADGKHTTRYQTLWPNRSHYLSCPACHVIYKGTSVYNRLLQQRVCPKCGEHKIENERPNPTEIIQQYHSHTDWLFLERRLKGEQEIPIGLELEIQSRISNSGRGAFHSANKIYSAQIEINPKANEFYFEWDGSLHDGGFEMITNPMTMSYHRWFWTPLLPKMREVAVGWNAHKVLATMGTNYGIHCTMHRKYLTQVQLIRLCAFHNNVHNAEFLTMIAQRDEAYRTGKFYERHRKWNEVIAVDFKKGKVLHGMEKYNNIYVKESGLVEFRLFRSTLNTQSFFKNIEYVQAVIQWCQETPYSDSADKFLRWLTNSAKHWLRYPNLIGFLQRPQIALGERGKLFNWDVPDAAWPKQNTVPPTSMPEADYRYREDLECA